METRLVKVKDVSPRDEQAWRELATRALEPNPFFEPDFLLLCAKHFEGYADTTLVFAHEHDTLRGVLPIVRFDRPRIPPRMVATTGGQPTAVRSLGTPLVDSSCGDSAVGALLDALHDAAKSSGWPGILLLDKLSNDGPVVECLNRMCKARGFPVFTKETWDRGVVHRGGRWEDPFTRSRQRQIAKTRRNLVRDGEAEVTLIERTLDPRAADDFLVMEASGWKGREGGLAFALDPNKAAWFREWCSRWAAIGRLVVLCLQVGEIPVAMEFFVRAGDGFYDFRGAYDETYSKYGPGAMVLKDAMEYLLEHTDALWIDSATDKDNAFLLEILPERRTLSTLLIGTGGTLDRSVVSALPTMTKVVETQRQVHRRWAQKRSKEHAPAPS
jgi:hypothetical protein